MSDSESECLSAIAMVAESLVFLMPTGVADSAPESWMIQVQVQWIGPDDSRGRIIVALDRGAAEATAANMLGQPAGEPPTTQDVQESCSELANVVAGNLLSVLYGNDHEFHLRPPENVAVTPLHGSRVMLLALVEGVIGVSIHGDADNSRILKAVRVSPEQRA